MMCTSSKMCTLLGDLLELVSGHRSSSWLLRSSRVNFVYTFCVHILCTHYWILIKDSTRILTSVLRRNRTYCRAIQRTALEKSKTPHHDMSKPHFIDLAIVESMTLSCAIFPFFAPPLNRLKLLTVVSVSFQSLTNTSLRG